MLTSQQAGSIVLGTSLVFPSNSSTYAALAASLEAYLQTNPDAAFASDSTFTSQYGPVVFSGFNSVGLDPNAPPLYQSDFAQVEGSVDTSPAAPELHIQGASLAPIEAGDMARIESTYGTYIPVGGYSPPPPPLSPPPPPFSPPPPGSTTATAAATTTATPTPTATSSAVGACSCTPSLDPLRVSMRGWAVAAGGDCGSGGEAPTVSHCHHHHSRHHCIATPFCCIYTILVICHHIAGSNIRSKLSQFTFSSALHKQTKHMTLTFAAA